MKNDKTEEDLITLYVTDLSINEKPMELYVTDLSCHPTEDTEDLETSTNYLNLSEMFQSQEYEMNYDNFEYYENPDERFPLCYEPPSPLIPLPCDQSYEREGNNVPDYMLAAENPNGLFFGKKCINGVDYCVTKPTDCEGHVVIIGGSGKGKSSSIIIPTLCRTWSDPFFAIDINGELHREYEKNPQKRNFKIFSLTEETGFTYEPFQFIRTDKKENLVANVQELANSLIPLPQEIKETFWIESARGILTATLLYYYNLGLHFIDAMMMLAATSTKSLIMEIYRSCNSDAIAFIAHFLETKTDAYGCTYTTVISDSKMLLSIRQTLTNRLSIFATDTYVIRAFSPSCKAIQWEDLESYNIFLSISEVRMEQYGGILTMMISQLIRHLQRRPDIHSPESADKSPILLSLDEFAQLGKIELMTSAISTLRHRNVTICLALQSMAQFDLIYGEKTRQVIMENCGFKAILGATDADTQEYLSRLIGDIDIPNYSFGENYYSNKEVSGYATQVTEARKPIIYPSELATLTDIIILTPQGFCRIDKKPYYTWEKTSPMILYQKENKMSNINEKILQTRNKVEQLEKKKRLQDNRQKQKQTSLDNRRKIIVGELVAKYFPEVLQFQPRRTVKENEIEFKNFENFLSLLADDRQFVEQLKEKARMKELPDV